MCNPGYCDPTTPAPTYYTPSSTVHIEETENMSNKSPDIASQDGMTL